MASLKPQARSDTCPSPPVSSKSVLRTSAQKTVRKENKNAFQNKLFLPKENDRWAVTGFWLSGYRKLNLNGKRFT